MTSEVVAGPNLRGHVVGIAARFDAQDGDDYGCFTAMSAICLSKSSTLVALPLSRSTL
jgi:hypothetical protein